MSRIGRPFRGLVCVATLVLLLAGCGEETGSPQDVIRDFDADGLVDGQVARDKAIDVTHTYSDLVHAKALMAAQNPGQYASFVAAVDVAIKQNLIGISPTQPPGNASPSKVPDINLPLWASIAAGGAGLLVLGGVGSAIYRRARRRPA